MKQIGLNALLTIISNFAFILITFKVISNLRLENYVNNERKKTFRIFIVLLSTAIGFLVSQFFLGFIDNVRNLGYLV